MFIRIFAFLALALALSGTQTRACVGVVSEEESGVSSCTDMFNSGTTTGTFDFAGTGDGVITFKFDKVLTPFDLTVTANEVISITNLDETEFPLGTVCIPYTADAGGSGFCVRYDVTGNVVANPPHDVPIRGVNYRGLITVTLNYKSFYTPSIPAFGHDPENNPQFSEDILTFYVDQNAPSCTGGCEEPAMGGKTPGISSFAALDKPFPSGQGDRVCFLTAVPQTEQGNSLSDDDDRDNPIVEVSFKLVASNCSTDPPLRDKTATLSVASLDTNGNLVFASLVNGGDSNKFHFDKKNGVNVQDINTNNLPSGLYYVTVISTLFSPVTTTFTIP
jgi:hypothetical protein